MVMRFIVFLFSLLFISGLYCQPKIYQGVIENNDTLLFSALPTLTINSNKWSLDKREIRVLKYRIKKVYPYAQEAINIYFEIQDSIAGIKKRRKRKKIVRQTERSLKGEYLKDLKNLTISQGKILMMLISRGTKRSCYEIIKAYKGGLKASYWQGVAHLFTYDLKEVYDPSENPEFEMITIEIEKLNELD